MLSIDLHKQLSHFKLDVQLRIHHELVVLLGRSGSGKTTLLNCIAGLSKPDGGTISIDDQCVYDGNRVFIPPQRRGVGYIFQDYALFPHMTVQKNVEYALTKSERAVQRNHVDAVLETLGISHLRKSKPREISGGEKQRVAVARALVRRPRVLLMDEPFSALDEWSKEEGYGLLESVQQDWQIPILLVTHNYREAERLGDRLIYMEEGRLC
ncbi:molybdate ABC transporter ATP-binding protein [Pontibacillus halophilus JSM 076056 = DSM 19796]|uniref:Molybdate ABC transporter ATP-binding protein n=1 Tax=Pontibacillus halophilus JSM 076056 = DSM 19796 TaxID=1385510 RepID=A0A0A5GKT3_9BACI|nr:ATP-binding cassette domain-containing protein [Pontibacillus halophilus]KGX92569.1 molybdate ABC transporter ATP-binding protein [Pontibacillus halophilus JSM 076056 = DSM 19796]